jgi:hypothetical protein
LGRHRWVAERTLAWLNRYTGREWSNSPLAGYARDFSDMLAIGSTESSA